MAEKKVLFLDTTLRDGEQSAGIGMTGDEKLEIARQLARLRVDVIEAGFAASSPGDFKAVEAIAYLREVAIIVYIVFESGGWGFPREHDDMRGDWARSFACDCIGRNRRPGTL